MSEKNFIILKFSQIRNRYLNITKTHLLSTFVFIMFNSDNKSLNGAKLGYDMYIITHSESIS